MTFPYQEIEKTRIFAYVVVSMIAMQSAFAGRGMPFKLQAGTEITLSIDKAEAKVVHTALQLFERDCHTVLSASLQKTTGKGHIIVGTLGHNKIITQQGIDLSPLKNKHEAFLLQVLKNGDLLIVGSDKRGTAYGIMELSRLMGVSPWEWWADSTPLQQKEFILPPAFSSQQSPSVAFRGIFINDEDWGFTPWSSKNYEPSLLKGQIGPHTYERVFELLLRLRANTLWPAMHNCSVPFYYTPGNKEMADRYGIYIGTSHCEPMMRNTNGEWHKDGNGDYDYLHNQANVLHFWKQRIKEVSRYDNLYTLGMRGVHDGKMNGVKTITEQKAALENIFKDQRNMLSTYVNHNLTKIPQVFIPYKEVLDVYNAGLQVPDDVTLMWCDDNYGYIRHFPTQEESKRKGGNGIYYHISYWGRPHDYLWLGTTSPGLIYQQMLQAYKQHIRKIWIVNVGDIKPSEYQIELFLDMAWNIDHIQKEGVRSHLYNFLFREFGEQLAKRLLPVVKEYYRLTYICKPEYLGHTRVEEKDPAYKTITDIPWSENQIQQRINNYQNLSDEVERYAKKVSNKKRAAYFELIKYPIQAAAQMNFKLLKAQLARHNKAEWTQSDLAFDSIVTLTKQYNKGKWKYIMDFQPRKLPVFSRIPHRKATEAMLQYPTPIQVWNGANASKGSPLICDLLGYDGKAASIEKNTQIKFGFTNWPTDSITIEIKLLPNHPVEGDKLRFSITLDKSEPYSFSYETRGRSEEWKENVLRNQAIRHITLPIKKSAQHSIIFRALDKGVVLDQIAIYK